MKPEVEEAIEGIRCAFPTLPLDVTPDPDGGAFVRIHDVDLGAQFTPRYSWCIFRITFQYPFADVYPHYFINKLQRVSGDPLPNGFHVDNACVLNEVSEPATMVSRRSNRLNPATDTAALKLQKVLDWIRAQ